VSKDTSHHAMVWICRLPPFDKVSGLAFPSSLLSTSAWWNDSPTPALAHVLKARRTALRAAFLRTSSQRLPNAYVKVRRFQAHRRTKRSLFTRVRGIEILRTSPFGHSTKFAYIAFSETTDPSPPGLGVARKSICQSADLF
jgi:hypothetical protein